MELKGNKFSVGKLTKEDLEKAIDILYTRPERVAETVTGCGMYTEIWCGVKAYEELQKVIAEEVYRLSPPEDTFAGFPNNHKNKKKSKTKEKQFW